MIRQHRQRQKPLRFRFRQSWLLTLVTVLIGPALAGQGSETARIPHGLAYQHEEIPAGPWSTHVVRIARQNPDFELHAALPRGTAFGLATLSDHIRAMPREWGRPVAGINGDFFRRKQPYLGDPKGLQICRGELVSAPCDWSCFWIDAEGNPHMTNVLPRFVVTWPTGEKTPFGLNEERLRSAAVLYTRVVGSTTQTSGGRELILEQDGTGTWLPLQVGMSYTARVREVREGGNSPIAPQTMVLSLGRQVAAQVPVVKAGDTMQISTATWPDLKGATTGLGGGPPLVRDGKVIERDDARVRHPRAAVGWNNDLFFLVEVDGRQRGLSVGMTIRELAEYMVRLGCTEALNLDGGGSATCWVYGQVMNMPSQGGERGMGNALVVIQKDRK